MFPELLRKQFPDLEAGKIALLEAHWELLRFWNKRLNLTTINGLDAAIERHYAESLFLGSRLPLGPLQAVDIGSGAGFPGCVALSGRNLLGARLRFPRDAPGLMIFKRAKGEDAAHGNDV